MFLALNKGDENVVDDVSEVGVNRVERMAELAEEKEIIISRLTAAVVAKNEILAESLQVDLRNVKLEMKNLFGVPGEPGRLPPL